MKFYPKKIPDEFSITNYEMIAHPNVEKNSGRGTIMYIHKNINYKQIEIKINDEQFQEAIFTEIKLKGNDKLLCACMYRRCESSEENNELLFNTMRKIADQKNSHLILMGDFNLNWTECFYTGNNTEHVAFKFIECVRDCFLFQHVTEHIRQRGNDHPSTLDLIFSNKKNGVRPWHPSTAWQEWPLHYKIQHKLWHGLSEIPDQNPVQQRKLWGS